jgi:dolichyl-diphosphooligosaccharide--protein glycosyltransferase
MQFTSVFIKQFILPDWSINDICCLVPPWFGVLATISVALLTYECSRGPFDSILNNVPIVNVVYRNTFPPFVKLIRKYLVKLTGSAWGIPSASPETKHPSLECAFFAAAIMAIVPAHLMRSIGGGYDNESIAVTAMSLTFYLWTRSLRGTEPNYVASVLSGIAYFYMVAAWGGYVFVLNLIGLHASLLVLLGRYSTKLHRAFTLFYLVGTSLAIQVPVVGWTPIRSLEQMGPLLAFGGFQLIEICQVLKRKRNLSTLETWKLRIVVFAGAGVALVVLTYILAPTGYFGPISSRVRGLFVKHTKTGNPLVDSVAEHQPASPGAYFQYLHDVCYIVPVGIILVAFIYMNDSSSFLLVYGAVAYFFSHRMVRLILLTAPIASVLSGIALGHAWAWCLGSVVTAQPTLGDLLGSDDESSSNGDVTTAATKEAEEKKKKGKKSKKQSPPTSANEVSEMNPLWVRGIRMLLSLYLISRVLPFAKSFYEFSWDMGEKLSNPSIIVKAQNSHDGRIVTIDDYREAYWWLRDNTPEDARIMAWWDYGYQITGISNRTTIADGNTWNHEHIALLGRALTSPEKEGHRIARHLADYVLVWAGGGGDDLAKSPHLARIANSVYRHMCPGDPTCRSFGFNGQGQPSAKMSKSLLYKLHSHQLVPGVEADRNRFKLVYQSKYGKVRIFKILSVSMESKEWVADPANRICDVEGGWFCRGQYPPALQKILAEKKDFKQLEDFNAKHAEDDSEYQRKYHENLQNPNRAQEQEAKKRVPKLSEETIDVVNQVWDDTELTSAVYDIIAADDFESLRGLLVKMPEAAHVRSKDGRGPMFWAHEKGRTRMVNALRILGVRENVKDAQGRTPLEGSTVVVEGG